MAFKSRGVVGKLQREKDFQVPGCFMLTLRGSLPYFMDLSTRSITVGQVLYKGRKGKSPIQDSVFLDMLVNHPHSGKSHLGLCWKLPKEVSQVGCRGNENTV